MGTNYYARFNICECCGRLDELHLGKSSAGWAFSFRAHEKPKLHSYKDILQWLQNKKAVIVNEYGKEITLPEFRDVVENRSYKALNFIEENPSYGFLDPEGHPFTEREFS